MFILVLILFFSLSLSLTPTDESFTSQRQRGRHHQRDEFGSAAGGQERHRSLHVSRQQRRGRRIQCPISPERRT